MRYLVLFLLVTVLSFGDDLASRLKNLISDKTQKSVVVLRYNPFSYKIDKLAPILAHKQTKTSEKAKLVLNLVTILGDKAFIDGKWMRKNDIIHGYKLSQILKNRVILSKKRKKIVLRFKESRKILKVRKK